MGQNALYHPPMCLNYFERSFEGGDTINVIPFSSFRDGKRVLVVSDNGGWGVVDETVFNLVFAEKQSEYRNLSQNIENADEFLKALYDQGLISINGKSIVNKKQHEIYKDYHLDMLILRLTNRCNLRCAYCYDNCGADGQSMPEHVGKKAIDSALERCTPVLDVCFHGGEPLTECDLMNRLLEYGKYRARERGKRINFICQTNGLLLSEEIIEYLYKNKIGFGVSLDGFKESHNQCRVLLNNESSVNIILDNLKMIREKKFPLPGILTTITNRNVSDMVEICEFFEKEGFSSIKFSFFFPQGRGKANNELLPNPRKILQGFKGIIQKVINNEIWNLRINNLIEYLGNILLFDRIFMCKRNPCGAGRSLMTVDVDGTIYPCDCLGGNLKLGNISSTSLQMAHKSEGMMRLSTRTQDTNRKCFTCIWRSFCGGGCPAHSLASFDDVGGINDTDCVLGKTIFRYLMWALSDSNELLEYFNYHIDPQLLIRI
ncbi:MAG: radical SAM protein [Theionarchaea archaeon]|nr:radical SAM protein [Theionarchaea archaeon]